MSSDEEFMDCIPPEVLQAAHAALQGLVPEKSWEVEGGKRGTTAFKYVRYVIKNFDHTKDEIEVLGLRSVEKDKKTFVVNDKDRSFIGMSQIIGILLYPIISLNGERIRYTFNGKVNVFEC